MAQNLLVEQILRLQLQLAYAVSGYRGVLSLQIAHSQQEKTLQGRFTQNWRAMLLATVL